MKFFVGVTDNEWFRFLSGLDAPEEVNFWRARGPQLSSDSLWTPPRPTARTLRPS
jgi:hypothetical protein